MPLKFTVRGKKKKKEGGAGEQGGWDVASLRSASSTRSDGVAGIQSVYNINKIKSLPKLHRSAAKGNLLKTKKLTVGMKRSALNSTDKEKRTALHFASAGGHEELVVHLCSEEKVDPNLRDTSGCTPLHRCVQAGMSTECITKLIEAGARVNEADRQGRTPLHEAAERGRGDVIALLQPHGADVDALDMAGSTALHLAARAGQAEAVSQLVRDGAELDKTDGEGLTALMLGAREGKEDVVGTLREANADPEHRDQSGRSAIDHALRNNHQKCAHLLQGYQLNWTKEMSDHSHPHSSLSSHPLPTHTVPNITYTPISTPPTDHHPVKDPQDQSWNSESEDDDTPDAPPRDFSTPRGQSSGVNLREAMARAAAGGRQSDKGHQSLPLLEPRPPVGVVNEGVEKVSSSDWDEEDSDPAHPANSAHSPTAAAAGELSAGQRAGPGSIPSSESESDLPMFGGYTLSSGATPLQPSRLPAISQGQPRGSSQSPTIVTPLSTTAGGFSPVEGERLEMEDEPNEQGPTLQRKGNEVPEKKREEDEPNEQGPTLQRKGNEVPEKKREEDEPNEDMEVAAAKRMYERDNEFLLTFQARQQRKQENPCPDSKSDSVPFPDTDTPSPRDAGTNVPGSSGSVVKILSEQWEKGTPLQLPACNEPRLKVPGGGGVLVVGVAKETPVSVGGREGESQRTKSGVGDGGDGVRGEGGDSPSGSPSGGGDRIDGGNGASGGGDRGDGGNGASGGGDRGGGDRRDGDRRDGDKGGKDDKSSEEEEEEEKEEEEVEVVQGESSTTPLLQTLHNRPHSSQSDNWDSDSSSDPALPPPPPLHSTLLPSSPGHLLTPSHLHYLTLTNVKSDEGGQGVGGAKPEDISSATVTPARSHDHSHVSSAHQSLIDSAHLSNLATSLNDTEQSLNRSQRSVRSVEEGRRRVQAQLEETQGRLGESQSARHSLETAKLDMELKLREVEYQLQQERESIRSTQSATAAVREQLSSTQERLSREVELREAAELGRRGAELVGRGHQVEGQQAQERIRELTSHLQTEREARAVQEGLYREQLRLSQELQTESARVQEQRTEVKGQLEAANSSRQSLEEKLQRLQKENTQLQVELSGERCRCEEVRGRLEGELREVRERLREKTETLVSSENNLLTSRQKFECDLEELRGKVGSLSAGLDSETLSRRQLETERDHHKTQLEKASCTLQATIRRAVRRERELQESLEKQRGERETAERELARSEVRLEQMNSQTASLETRVAQLEAEREERVLQVEKLTNRNTELQRELEQRQQQLSLLEEALAREKVESSGRGSELTARERELSLAQGEVARLKEELGVVRKREEERETSASQEHNKHQRIVETLRSEFDQKRAELEEECRRLTQEVERSRERETERERLQSLLQEAAVERERVEGELRGAQESLAELERERRQEKQTATERESELVGLRGAVVEREREREQLQQQLTTLQSTLSHSEERGGEFGERVRELEREVGGAREREEGLRGELAAMREERTRLQEMVSQVRGEAIQLRDEKEALQVALQLAQREAGEARGLWETEIRSRASMSLRLVQLERSQNEVAPTIETERQRTRTAEEQRKAAEGRYHSLQEHCGGLEREVAELRAELRAAQEGAEKEAESRRTSSRNDELSSLRQELERTQQQLERQEEERERAEQSARHTSHQLASLAALRETSSRDKELRRLEKSKRQLEERVRRLEETMSTAMVDRQVMEVAVSRAEDEAHLKLSQKLQEVNSHLQQQSVAQCGIQRRMETELREQRELLQKQSTLASKFKGLYEAELGCSERLAERVREAETSAHQAHSRVRFERSRNQYLTSHPHPLTTSTPHKTGQSSTDHLLESVRSELDRSISKHLASIPTAGKWSGGHQEGQGAAPSTSRHLDSIRRNYHV